MTAEARALFLARVGVDSRLLVSELEKLRCYCGEGATAGADDVQAVVSLGREAEIWGILDAFGDRDAPRLTAQLRTQLGQSESPIGLVSMLESRVSELLIVRQALDRGWAAPGSTGMALNWRDLPPAIEAWFTASDNDFRRMNPYRAGRLAAQAVHWSLRELRWARHLLVGLREALVSSSLPGGWLTETRLLQAIGTRRPARGRAAAPMGR
jgi:DNA polymerase-3 subunit delta